MIEVKKLRERAIIREILEQRARVEAQKRALIRDEEIIRTILREPSSESIPLNTSDNFIIESKTFVKEPLDDTKKSVQVIEISTHEASSQTDFLASHAGNTERESARVSELITNNINRSDTSNEEKISENNKLLLFEYDSVQKIDASVMKRRESITDVIIFLKTIRFLSDNMQSALFVGPYENSDEEY